MRYGLDGKLDLILDGGPTAGGLESTVLDLTTTELADELVGGILTAGRDRLTAAGLRGVPQVISLGNPSPAGGPTIAPA